MSEGVAFGGWLKQRRRESGVTQEELAESIGCSGTAIRKIEIGERHPSPRGPEPRFEWWPRYSSQLWLDARYGRNHHAARRGRVARS